MSDRELPKAPFRPNHDLLILAQDILEAVATGKITSLACVTVSPLGQMQWPGCGMQIAEMMIGAELMRDDMKQAMRGAGASKILRAG